MILEVFFIFHEFCVCILALVALKSTRLHAWKLVGNMTFNVFFF